MRYAIFDGVLCRRQGLAKYLATEYLRTTDITAVTTKDIQLDALELQQADQVVEDRVHVSLRYGRRRRRCRCR